MGYSKEYMELLKAKVAYAEKAFAEAMKKKDALIAERTRIVQDFALKRDERLSLGGYDLQTMKRIRHRAIRLLWATKRERYTITEAHYVAFLREHLGVDLNRAKIRASKKFDRKMSRIYDYYNRYLLQRRFAIQEIETEGKK